MNTSEMDKATCIVSPLRTTSWMHSPKRVCAPLLSGIVTVWASKIPCEQEQDCREGSFFLSLFPFVFSFSCYCNASYHQLPFFSYSTLLLAYCTRIEECWHTQCMTIETLYRTPSSLAFRFVAPSHLAITSEVTLSSSYLHSPLHWVVCIESRSGCCRRCRLFRFDEVELLSSDLPAVT